MKATDTGATALTELEGAILSEIGHRGNHTAFQVRRAFERSPSREWSGSSGAIYPAIRRLEAAGLIAARETGDGRGARHLSLTPAGEVALDAWLGDVRRAVSIGVDPFRVRLSLWQAMPPVAWVALRGDLRNALTQSNEALRAYAVEAAAVERPGVEMALSLNAARLAWLDGQ